MCRNLYVGAYYYVIITITRKYYVMITIMRKSYDGAVFPPYEIILILRNPTLAQYPPFYPTVNYYVVFIEN